ncbi:LacI family DNA-binding transcriptional regulator [Paenibacillus sp. R14(2021)]|uniref:LacI family DNA-binding transcriptional regulator n=1 Tax=Paenibacillus sp. R14(2021) TaxID=2859228 RepID=UPI001C613E66|nr:LacI family DNA-binding transcriptional regulator [Paenibacillus sp. R14(2021)]
MRNITMNSTEIAKRAGVSRSTVSRVINNYSNVPDETREKVMKVIRKYNYVPNVSAQVLAGKAAKTIGLFLIEKGEVGDALTNLLLASVIDAASTAGYYVLTSILRDMEDAEAVQNVRDIFYQRRIDGGVFIGARSREPLIEALAAEGFMVAVMDQKREASTEPNRIAASFDNTTGMKLAVNYLASLGHRDIAVINGDMNRPSGPSKHAGFVSAMQAIGLPLRSDWVLAGSFHENSGYEAVQGLLARSGKLPTALIAVNDSAAFGAMKAFKENGLRIPEDISIIGFDDHPLSAMVHPALTTVRVNFKEMMQRLTNALIHGIEQAPGAIHDFEVGCELVIRDSCMMIIRKESITSLTKGT